MTLAALDYETKATYEVMVTATDPDSASDMITVTITVTNEDEMGMVTLWAGADALTMAPQVGDTITGAVMDPDGGDSDGHRRVTWQWARTMDTADMSSWTDIAGETNAAYMVMEGDTGYYLRVMATYTDAAGTDMDMGYSPATMMVTAMMTVPMFDSETATREVAENTGAGMDIGAPVTATDANDDTLTYALGGTHTASFDIGSATGQLMTKEALDYETKATYSVTVTASDSGGLSDSIDVTITVTNEDEMGRVTFWRDGVDATAAAIMVGDMLSGLAEDPDGNVGDTPPITDMYSTITGETWQWAKTMTPDMMDSWMPITDATAAAYEVMDADEGYHLRATAMYDDGEGMGKMASEKTMMVTTAPEFADSEDGARSVAENTGAGMDIGAPVTATDANDDTLTYALGGTHTASFDIGSATGQLMTKEALDYETKATYSVTVTASDSGGLSDSIDVTITVTNEDEMGRVTFWRGGVDATAAAIMVGDMLSGLAEDPDGNVGDTPPITDMYSTITGETWQWAKTMTPDMMDSWMPITDATAAAYEVMDADEGYHLRATAMYDDGEGMGKMASEKTMMVTTAPEFADSEDGARSVAENTGAGMDIGAPVTATDANDDTLTYALGGTHTASFDIGSATGQLMTKEALDYETKATYSVTVTASDSGGLSDSIDVTITVTNEDEMGRVTFWRGGVDATAAAIMVGDMLSGLAEDPDGNVGDTPPITDMYSTITGETWQWAKTMTPDMMDSWMPITDATAAAYEVMDADEGYHLRATAMYDDGEGMGKMASEKTMMVTTAPEFADSEDGARSVAENTGAGMDIGAPVTATDANDDTLTYALGGTHTASFDIGSATGQLMTKEALDYETKATYSVTVTASDSGGLSDSIDVTITVTNEDEMGRVTFWRDGVDATAAAIMVGDMLSGLAEDPDGNVGDTPPITDMYSTITGETWQWAKTMTPDMMDSWMPITDATAAAYEVMDADEGYHLRATAMYDDGEGMGKMASEKTMMVTAVDGDTLLDRYDLNNNGIEKPEVLKAINDYLFPEGEEVITKPEVLRLINLYLFP